MSVVEQPTSKPADVQKRDRLKDIAIGATLGAALLLTMAAWIYILLRMLTSVAVWLLA